MATVNKVIIQHHPANSKGRLPVIYEREDCTTVHGVAGAVYICGDSLIVSLSNIPERIDYDPNFNSLFILDDKRVSWYPEPRKVLEDSTLPSETVWQREVTPVAKA